MDSIKMKLECEVSREEIDEMFWNGAVACVQEAKGDNPPLVIAFIGNELQVYPVGHMMDGRREAIGALVNDLVTTPGIDYVGQVGQGYGLEVHKDDPAALLRYALFRGGIPIKDIPGRVEMVTVTIYDKTQPQCTAWTAQHIVGDGYQLTRGKLHEMTQTGGRMTAPIPRRQDA